MRSKRQSTTASRGSPLSECNASTPIKVLNTMNSSLAATIYDCIRYNRAMALTLYWGSGSPFSWRVLLALEEHKASVLRVAAPALRPAGTSIAAHAEASIRADGCRSSRTAITWYSSRLAVLVLPANGKYPQAPIFGPPPEEAGVIMRVIC